MKVTTNCSFVYRPIIAAFLHGTETKKKLNKFLKNKEIRLAQTAYPSPEQQQQFRNKREVDGG